MFSSEKYGPRRLIKIYYKSNICSYKGSDWKTLKICLSHFLCIPLYYFFAFYCICTLYSIFNPKYLIYHITKHKRLFNCLLVTHKKAAIKIRDYFPLLMSFFEDIQTNMIIEDFFTVISIQFVAIEGKFSFCNSCF